MNYFVTGGTGFIGKFLVERLAKRKDATVYVLVRESSMDKFEALKERIGEHADKLVPIIGDITKKGLIAPAKMKKIKGQIDHVFHLAAIYDMDMDDETADWYNVEGTRNVVQFANKLGGDVRLHHTSSVAVAGGSFRGRFTEDMFDEGQSLNHPYYRTKFESEQVVREECKVPFRVYRPGIVIGSSVTGEIDKIDGPYYFFKMLQTISYKVPKWLPLLGIHGGKVPIVPVDYVAAAMDAIAHKPGWDGKAFFLLQSKAPSLGEVIETFLTAGHGPGFATKLELPWLTDALHTATGTMERFTPEMIKKRLSKVIGAPVSTIAYSFMTTIFDDKNARAALKGTGIKCPNLADYASVIWQYWEQHLDYDREVPARMAQKLAGKVVLITGASSGIGFATAKKLAGAGARVILVARTREKLEETQRIIENMGGEAYVYPCDLNDLEGIDKMAEDVLRDFGHVDVLVNNAGRSIRRAVEESYDRFHDFQRTMQLNYFGAVRLIMALLPTMQERKSGHVINISSIGVQLNAARFSAYVASKAALDAFSRCLSAEVKAYNIEITAIYMPLVRTPMIAPTKIYNYVPTWSPLDAANTIVRSILERPKSVATPVGTAAAISYALWPKVNDFILSKGFQLFPSSAAAKGKNEAEPQQAKPTLEQVLFALLFKGEHW
ncbi:MAG: SDR family oxidoreductase [Blastocatellia bacterium]|nr:SDR family oxidoreductase [Blastocatellia bacterium]